MATLINSPTLVAVVYGNISSSGTVHRVDRVLDLTSSCRSLNISTGQEWSQSSGYRILTAVAGLRNTEINGEFLGLHDIVADSAVIVIGVKGSFVSYYGHISAIEKNYLCTEIRFKVSKQFVHSCIPKWLDKATKEMADIVDQQLAAIAAGYAVSKIELRKSIETVPAEVIAEPVIVRRKRTITTLEEV